MAIQGFCPPSPSPPSHSPSPSPYYQLLERGSARLGRVKKCCYNGKSVCKLHSQKRLKLAFQKRKTI